MNAIHPTIEILVAVAGIYVWKKSNNKRYLYFFWIAMSSLAVSSWNYLAINVFHLAGQEHSINAYVVVTLRVVLLVLAVFVTLKRRFD
jgi:hypothetical protein